MRIRSLIGAIAAGLALAVAPAHAQDASGDPDVVTDGTTDGTTSGSDGTTDGTGDTSGDPTLDPALQDADSGLAPGQDRVKTHEFSSQVLPDGSYVETKVSTIEHPVNGTTRIHERTKTTAPDGSVKMAHTWTRLDADGQVIETRSISPHAEPTDVSTDEAGTGPTPVESLSGGESVDKPGLGLGRSKAQSAGPAAGPPGLQKPNRPSRPSKVDRPGRGLGR